MLAEVAVISQVRMIERKQLALINIFNQLANRHFDGFTKLMEADVPIVLQVAIASLKLGSNKCITFRAKFRKIFLKNIPATLAIIYVQ